MAAPLAHFAAVHHQDLVGTADGREAVGDDDGGALAHQLGDGVLDELFGLGVDAGGRLVEDEDFRVEGQGPGKGQQLALAGRQSRAAFGYGVGKALGKAFDEGRGVDVSGCALDLGVVDGVVAEADIAADTP